MCEIKWAASDIINFLNIYQKYDCLWDASCPEYIKRDKRDISFQNLIEELKTVGLNITLEPLKKKIKSIRDTYRNELTRIKKSKKTGTGTKDVYKPKLAWFSTAHSFLHQVFHGRESSSNLELNTQSTCPENENGLTDEEELHNSRGEPSHDSNNTDDGNMDLSSTSQVHQSTQVETPTSSNFKSKSPKTMNPPVSRPVKRLKPATLRKNTPTPSRFESTVDKLQHIANLTESTVDDQYDAFGKHIAAQLREMPLRSFIILQQKIQNLIASERLSIIESQMPSSQSNLSHNNSNSHYRGEIPPQSPSYFSSDDSTFSQQEIPTPLLPSPSSDVFISSNNRAVENQLLLPVQGDQQQGIDIIQKALYLTY